MSRPGIASLLVATSAGLFLATVGLLRAAEASGTKPVLPTSSNLMDVEERVLPSLKEQFAAKGLQLGNPVFVRVFKETRELELWVRASTDYQLFKTYPICSYSGALGPKLKEGDRQRPEGFYKVAPSQMNPNSSFHLSFNLGFPNRYDRAWQRTGSYLMVHGNCVSIGCYAMTNQGIEEIYLAANEAFKHGQDSFPVHSFPFRMTGENMSRHSDSDWVEFWGNLKEGYDAFESTRIPPVIQAKNQRYLVERSIGISKRKKIPKAKPAS